MRIKEMFELWRHGRIKMTLSKFQAGRVSETLSVLCAHISANHEVRSLFETALKLVDNQEILEGGDILQKHALSKELDEIVKNNSEKYAN